MTPNPYESPRPGEPLQEKTVFPSDPLLSLLTEIRDLQRQTLEQNREAFRHSREIMERHQKYRAVPFVVIALSVAIMLVPIYRLWTLKPPTIPTPARSVPSPAMPPPAPTTFRAYE